MEELPSIKKEKEGSNKEKRKRKRKGETLLQGRL